MPKLIGVDEAGNPIEESAGEFDFESIEDDFSWIEGEKKPEQTGETESPAAEEKAAESSTDAISENEKARREDQSWKDKFYNLEGQLKAQSELLSKLVKPDASAQEQEGSDTDELEQLISDEWKDDPALVALLSKVRGLEKELSGIRQVEVQNTSKAAGDILHSFGAEYPELLTDQKLFDAFQEEIDDRLDLSGYTFEELVKAVDSGKPIPKNLLGTLSKKLEKAAKSVVGDKSAIKKKEEADKRVDKRADKPIGIQQKAAEAAAHTKQSAPPRKLSYEEAKRMAMGR